MPDKTVIITGGNAGLGYACAETLVAARQGWCVVMASRDPAKASAAAAKLIAQTPGAWVETLPLDLASLASVRSFAATFAARGWPPLRALVCNAGVQGVSGITYTQDGFESTFGVNHLGHFLLTHLLLKHLTAPARIVVVSSDTHDPVRHTGMPMPHFTTAEALAWPEKDPTPAPKDLRVLGGRRYTTSKLCNILFTYELARRLQKEGLSTDEKPITVNAFNPGLMPGTGLARAYPPLLRLGWYVLLPLVLPLARWFVPMNTVQASGRALARLVMDPALEAVSGQYFSGMEAVRSSQASYERPPAQELWEGSVKLVKLAQSETPLMI
jgi:NAD(P)-dependent dehydrogenase (short-subunit alcohol dehydrogenase family)